MDTSLNNSEMADWADNEYRWKKGPSWTCYRLL